ncbi:MAG TPA: FAD-dependent oxidoreductase [Baekduia sp.]|nr:FAD-dependent oxidoreductase [Baekduia sp.]
MEPDASQPLRVVIAGGGVAGLEAVLVLGQDAGPLTDVVLVGEEPEFRLRALSVKEPFAEAGSPSWPIEPLCAEQGAAFRRGRVTDVDVAARTVALADGASLPFDALVVATGAAAVRPFDGGTLFRGPRDVEAVHGLLQDVEEGYTRTVAFVVPPGTTWPLPLYELALMLAERASSLGLDGVGLTMVTPEAQPLEVFGTEAADKLAARLRDAGVEIRPRAQAARIRDGAVLAADDAVLAEAQRVVLLPRLEGRPPRGLPQDDAGFVPVDEHGRVRGADRVWAAGDGTSCAVKQGGIAAQQALAAASDIARLAGADVAPHAFEPVLRAELLTGGRSLWLHHALGGSGPGEAATTEHPLYWPPVKVAAPRLAAWIDAGGHAPPHAADHPRMLLSQGDPLGGIELLG